MCGITGILAFNEIGRLYMINMSQANEAQAHRGPDLGKMFVEERIGLAHRRLSILDLSPAGNQPMSDESGRYTIVYNGEIYNFKQIREELMADGVEFTSETDTEVLLQIFIKEGEKCLNKLDGFFSFCVFDAETDELFIARDRLGIKPLLYFMDEDKFVFASEMSGMLAYKIPRVVDFASLYQYFQFNYIPAPNSIFKNIFKLMPGHFMRVKKRDIKIQQYYKVPYSKGCTYQNALSYEESQKRLLELLDESVKERLIADVPLGAFLSGGIDSSAIVALASKHTNHLNTFSIGYQNEPMFDETKYAEMVAKKYDTNHTTFKLTNDDFYQHISTLLDFYGEPFADASQIAVYILCQRTTQDVTVALSGDGADEIFAGYNKYLGEFKARENGLMAKMLKSSLPVLNWLPKNRNTKIGNTVRQFHRFAEGMNHSPKDRYWFLTSWQSEEGVKKMFSGETLDKVDWEEYAKRKTEILQNIEGEDFNEILYADSTLLLPNDMLHKVDSMSMANGLEVRVPFLDHKIVNFAFSLPANYKINGGMKKRVLQDAVRHLLPKELYKRPKHGFDVPLMKGYKGALKGWVQEMLDDKFVEEQGVFSVEFTKKLKKTIFETSNYDQNQVWAILAFQHWWKKFEPKLEEEKED